MKVNGGTNAHRLQAINSLNFSPEAPIYVSAAEYN